MKLYDDLKTKFHFSLNMLNLLCNVKLKQKLILKRVYLCSQLIVPLYSFYK